MGSNIKKFREQTFNPFVLNMINGWYSVRELFGENSLIPCFSPIWGNDQFKPGKADQGFRLWATKGLTEIGDMWMCIGDVLNMIFQKPLF